MSIKTVKHLVLIPIGPDTSHEYAHDTIDSIRHYTDPDRRIILIDDRRKDDRFKIEGNDIDLIVNTHESGKEGKLHATINQGVIHALRHYRFEVMLRMDDDALIIGERPEDDAIERFCERPNVGQLGSFRLTCMGYQRDASWAAGQLNKEMYPVANSDVGGSEIINELARQLRKIYSEAVSYGYVDGESCIGCATYYSYECLKQLVDKKLIDIPILGKSRLAEDHIMGLLVKAAGMEIEEFEQGGDPLCLDWLNLPCAPPEILSRGKKITHTVKRWQEMDQQSIRTFFRQQRDLD